MQCCPTNIRDLGCFPSCQEAIALEGLSVTDGTLVTEYHGHTYTEQGDFTDAIPIENFNQDYTYVVQFYTAEGEVVSVGGFDAFRFTIKPVI